MPTLHKRVVNILRNPVTEWPVIAAERDSVGRLYAGYIIPMSAIPFAARIAGMTLFRGALQPLVDAGAATAVVIVAAYVVDLAALYAGALLIQWLAPKFKSSGSTLDALKVTAYSFTPVWLAGIGQILPLVGNLVALAAAAFAVYLCYLGLPRVMKTPSDQVVIFLIASVVLIVAVHVIARSMLAMILLGGA